MAQAPQLRSVPTPAASPAPLDMWPIVPDAPDIRAIVEDQAATIQAQDNLISAYQANLKAAQTGSVGTPAIGPATTSGSSTSLVVSSVSSGTIATGATISGTGVPTVNPPTILGQISGTPGAAGTYLMSATLNIATATTLTFTPAPAPSTWPIPNDADTLMLIQQTQTAILRVQSALISHYQDLLNQSQTPAPPSGP